MFKKVSKKVKKGIVFLEILLVLFIFVLAYNFFLPLGKEKAAVYFEKSDASSVLNTLSQNGYNITDWDHWLVRKKALPSQGWYRISHTDEGRYRFFNKLADFPLPVMRIIVYPGETHAELLHRLAKDMKLDEKKLHRLYNAMKTYEEANIFSGAYTIARNADENTTLTYLFDRSKQKLQTFMAAHYLDFSDPSTLKLLLTVASVIQKESNDPEEMPLIASVIYNRLDLGMKLQMDGTLNYGRFSHCTVTPERIKNDTTLYNTYKYKGLPPEPIATVSLDALNSAMFPAKSDYLFFMLKKEGGHVFAATYKEHLAHLKAFRKYQKEHQLCLIQDMNHTEQVQTVSNKKTSSFPSFDPLNE